MLTAQKQHGGNIMFSPLTFFFTSVGTSAKKGRKGLFFSLQLFERQNLFYQRKINIQLSTLLFYNLKDKFIDTWLYLKSSSGSDQLCGIMCL